MARFVVVDRSGHHRLDGARPRREAGAARARLPRVRAALPAAGLGRARPRGDLAVGARRARRRAARLGRRVDAARSSAIGITNQRETTLVWDRATGKPSTTRSSGRTGAPPTSARAEGGGHEDEFSSATGLVLDPYFSGTKLQWLLDNVDGLRARAERGELCFGTVDSYLVWRLTGGAVHVTDVTNASRTLLFDLHTLAVERAAAASCSKVPRALLPDVRGSSERYGETRGVPGLPDGIPICRHRRRSAGGAVRPGLLRRRRRQVHVRHRRVHADEHRRTRRAVAERPAHDGRAGSSATRSSTRSRARRSSPAPWCSGCATGSASSRRRARSRRWRASVPDSGGVVVVPALAGLGAPHWRPEARGIITGLTRGTTQAHLARATLEGIALQIADLLGAMQADAGVPLRALKVDGGAAPTIC